MAELRDKVQNNLSNAKRMMAGLIVTQKNEIERLTSIHKEFQDKYDKESDKLTAMDKNAVAEGYDEQVKRIQNLQTKLSATEEAIAQYQMNLKELGAI